MILAVVSKMSNSMYVCVYLLYYMYVPNLSPVDSVGELPPRSTYWYYIANERPRLGLFLRRRRPRARRSRGAGRWHTRRRRPAGGTSVQEMGNGGSNLDAGLGGAGEALWS